MSENETIETSTPRISEETHGKISTLLITFAFAMTYWMANNTNEVNAIAQQYLPESLLPIVGIVLFILIIAYNAVTPGLVTGFFKPKE